METNKILSSLCYFSVFFAPFLLPIIVYFVSKDAFVKTHAKRSLFSHFLPFITFVIFFVLSFLSFYSIESTYGWVIFAFVIVFIINFVVFIWNIIQGIKVLVH
ncbi:DUF4870 domain-containing protein [Bacillus sp. JJ664]